MGLLRSIFKYLGPTGRIGRKSLSLGLRIKTASSVIIIMDYGPVQSAEALSPLGPTYTCKIRLNANSQRHMSYA